MGLFSASSLRLSFLSRSLQFVLSLRRHSLPFVFYNAGRAQHSTSPPALCFAGSSPPLTPPPPPSILSQSSLFFCLLADIMSFVSSFFSSNVPTVGTGRDLLLVLSAVSRSALTSSPTLHANTCAHVPFGSNKVGYSFIAHAAGCTDCFRNAGQQLRCCSPAVAQRKPDQEAVQTQAANMMQAESSRAQAHTLTVCFSSFSICENI